MKRNADQPPSNAPDAPSTVDELHELRRRLACLEARETERQRAEIVQRLMPKVFMEGSDPIVIEDTEGCILDLNPEAEQIYGWTREELLGQPIKILIPPERHDQADELLLQCKRREAVRNVEGVRWNKAGERSPVLITLSLLSDDDGEPSAIATITKHIAELKRTQETLRQTIAELDESRNRYAAAARTSGQLLYDWDSATNQMLWDGPIVDILGYTQDELGEELAAWRALIHPEDQLIYDTAIGQLARTKEPTRLEYRVQCKDGTYCYVEDRGQFFVDRTGAIVRMVGFVADISERKQAEEEREKIHEELVERERLAAIGTTAAKLAHEIGNPLNGMYMSIQLLQQQLAKQPALTNGQIPQLTQILLDEINRLTQVLQEFRSLSRREQFSFAPLAVSELVAEILHIEAAHYAAHGIQVEQAVSAGLPLIRADRDKLKQALLNVCKNALEAMPNGGTLGIRATHTDEQLRIEVEDTGEGVPDNVNIFEPFATTKKRGTGLGLAIAQQIVAAHRGELSYTSQPRHGTTFTLLLPLASV